MPMPVRVATWRYAAAPGLRSGMASMLTCARSQFRRISRKRPFGPLPKRDAADFLPAMAGGAAEPRRHAAGSLGPWRQMPPAARGRAGRSAPCGLRMRRLDIEIEQTRQKPFRKIRGLENCLAEVPPRPRIEADLGRSEPGCRCALPQGGDRPLPFAAKGR